uniref:Uncharacterized protein n=1 Tax=Setaria viridis TaxID=4556 RepID=A0A4U6SYW0_SETVI|nr:hypothetical protein SEVIR_9G230450v2 [Setaria viridis]
MVKEVWGASSSPSSSIAARVKAFVRWYFFWPRPSCRPLPALELAWPTTEVEDGRRRRQAQKTPRTYL